MASLPTPTPGPPPGGALTPGVFALLDSLVDFLEDESRDAAAADCGGARPCRTAPGWDWAACRLLPLLQQYSGGLSDAVIRTSLWQAWRQGVDASQAACSGRWTSLATLAASADDAGPRAAVPVCATVRAAIPPPPTGLPAVLELDDGTTPRHVDAMVHSAFEGAIGGTLAPGARLRLAGARAWRPEVMGDLGPARLLPSEAMAVVVEDFGAGARVLGGGELAPPSVAAACDTKQEGERGPLADQGQPGGGGVLVAGHVAAVGEVEHGFAGAAGLRSRTGVARVAWLADAPDDEASPTPLLLLDGAAALGDLLAPGEGVVLRATAVPPRGDAPPALEVAGPCLAAVFPKAGAGVKAVGKENAAPPLSVAAAVSPTPGLSATPLPPRARRRTPLADLVPIDGVIRLALAGSVAASAVVCADGGRVLQLTLADASGCLDVCLPLAHATRGALALAVGDVALLTCAAARLVAGAARVECWPAAAANVQGLAALPALLSSPPLYAPAVRRLGDGSPLAPPALVEARVASVSAVAVRRTHAACGRPLVRAVLDVGDAFGDGYTGGSDKAPGQDAPKCGGLLLSSTGKLHTDAAACGGLWTCSFCGVDVGSSAAGAGLEAEVELVDGPARAKVSVRGDAACALLGTVPFEYLAWTPGQRSEAIVCLTGRRVRAALVPPPGGGRDGSAPTPCAVAEGVLVLDDDGDGAEADGGGRAG